MRDKIDRKPRKRRVTVEDAREWFRLFGFKSDCISPTGRRMFQALLSAIDRGRAVPEPRPGRA